MKLFGSRSSSVLVVFTVAAALLQLASAKPSFVVRIPNGANVPDVLAVGHADPEGSTRETNTFGDDFQKAGKKWTVALCQMDSDGDGQTNGQELGDPCCEWVQTTNEVLRWTDGVSDPGVKTKISSAKLLASVSCSGDSSASTPAASMTTTTAASTIAPTSTPAATSKSTTSSLTSPSSAPAAATPSASATASSTNSSSNSTAKVTMTPSTSTTPSSSTVKTPTTTPTLTSAAAGLSLGFPTLTLLSGVVLGAIAAFQG